MNKPLREEFDVQSVLHKIETQIARSEFSFRGQTVVESDALLHFIALVRQANKRAS